MAEQSVKMLVDEEQQDTACPCCEQEDAPRLKPTARAESWLSSRGGVWAMRAKSLVRRPTLEVYSLEGEYGGDQLRMLVADDGSTFQYFRSLAYSNEARVSRLGRISSVLAPRLAGENADIVVIGANQLLLGLYDRSVFHFAPKWVRMFLPIWERPDVMLKSLPGSSRNSVERMVRRAMKKGFDYEVTTDIRWFDRFYYEMYKPYVAHKYGDLAVLEGYSKIKRKFLQGAGLAVRHNGEDVGGVILAPAGSLLYFYRVGIMSGDDQLVKEGTSTALYYYTLLLAHSWGFSGVDFGHTRPFLSDGVLRYKMKWGMRVLGRDDCIGVFAIAAPTRSEAGARFLSENRFFHFTESGVKLCDEY
ncbi:MAG: hypothetical protein Q7N50_11235 [Armatimonadota bacterium]|nr:hypothetical protein [Armatimonadota bacterium]